MRTSLLILNFDGEIPLATTYEFKLINQKIKLTKNNKKKKLLDVNTNKDKTISRISHGVKRF